MAQKAFFYEAIGGLMHKCMKGHVGRDGKPLPCIGPEAKVRPVKVKISIEIQSVGKENRNES